MQNLKTAGVVRVIIGGAASGAFAVKRGSPLTIGRVREARANVRFC